MDGRCAAGTVYHTSTIGLTMSSAEQPTTATRLLVPGLEPLPGYRLVARLGGGGFGEVWKAEHAGFHVALKFVRLEDKAGPVEMHALDLIRELHHPNLVHTFGAWQIEGYLIIAMELAGGSLWDRFHERRSQGLAGIPRDELLDYFAQAARGIDYLNDYKQAGLGPEGGVQHRDIKPQNILLVGGGVKIADFGLARALEHSLTTNTGGMTPAYAAPEFFDGRTSRHSDQYCLAVTYCHLRGGRLPFAGTAAQLLAGHLMHAPDLTMLPPEERPAVARALAKDPRERWPNCRAFVESLRGTVPTGDAAGVPAMPAHSAALEATAPFVPPFTARTSPDGEAIAPTGPAGPRSADAPHAGSQTSPVGGQPGRRRRFPVALIAVLLVALVLVASVAGLAWWSFGRPGARTRAATQMKRTAVMKVELLDRVAVDLGPAVIVHGHEPTIFTIKVRRFNWTGTVLLHFMPPPNVVINDAVIPEGEDSVAVKVANVGPVLAVDVPVQVSAGGVTGNMRFSVVQGTRRETKDK
jgi:hypothetical protein